MQGEQLIVVIGKGSRCSIKCMEKRNMGYIQVVPTIFGYVGKGGVTADKWEGDMKTPAGVFKIGDAFGRGERIRTGLKYKKITSNSRWCCNPQSLKYNMWTNKRWEKGCEDLWKYRREYRYGAIIEYNMGEYIEKGKGSAIFLHCKNSPTAGCIAAEQMDIKRILAWLNSGKNPHIFIKGL